MATDSHTSLSRLPDHWRLALRQVKNRRSKKHYKPAALLVALDMIDDGSATERRVDFNEFDERFRALMTHVDRLAMDKGWEPFFHLSTGGQVWDLYRETGAPIDSEASAPRVSQTYVRDNVGYARVKPDLSPLRRCYG
jgi:hypothetical protein